MNKEEMADAHAAMRADINSLVIFVILCKRKCSKRGRPSMKNIVWAKIHCLIAGKHLYIWKKTLKEPSQGILTDFGYITFKLMDTWK